MKRSVVICVVTVGLLGLAGSGQARNIRARNLPGPVVVFVPDCPVEPFVAISVKPGALDLGQVGRAGLDTLSGRLTAHIVANCPYHVEASFAPFSGKGGSIQSEHTSVVINGRNVAVGGAAVPVTSSSKPTPAKGVDVRVDLKVAVDRAFQYLSGAYEGAVTFTIVPGR